jgi:AcrR family transcriptional regulator
MSSQPAERSRRSSSEVRELAVTAARELFLANGYEGATTIEIALRAGLSERLLFTNFGSKGALFREAMIPPFEEFADRYVQRWKEYPASTSVEEGIEGFVRGLLDIAEQNRVVLVAAIYHAQSNAAGPEAELLDEVARSLRKINELVESSGWDFDPGPVTAASASAVMGSVLLERLVFSPADLHPDRESLVKALTRFVLYGISPLFDPPLTPPAPKSRTRASTRTVAGKKTTPRPRVRRRTD